MRRTGVLIAGGGVSGLTAAYGLQRAGVDCIVAERASRLGGLIFTDTRDGLVMDGGPDAFLVQKPQALALCQELGLGDDVVPTNPDKQKVYILHGGKLHALPAGMRLTVPTRWLPLALSGLFTWRGKLRMLAERWTKPRIEEDEHEESVESFIVRRFGRECYERVGEPLLAGIHCGDGERLSMDFLFPRLVAMEKRHGSVSRGMAAAGQGGTAFASLKHGMRGLVDALSDRLPDGAVLMEHGVDEVRDADGGFETKLTTGETIASRAVIVALPIHASRDLLRGRFPNVAGTLDKIPTVSSAVVFHAYTRHDVEHPLDAYGFVVPKDEPNRLLAATFITSKFPGRAPEDQVLMRTFLGGLHDKEAMELSDDELIALSRSELARAIGPLGEPLFSKVVRWEQRTPQVQLGHRAILDELRDELEKTPGLYILGNGLNAVGIPDNIAEARATAKQAVDYLESVR